MEYPLDPLDRLITELIATSRKEPDGISQSGMNNLLQELDREITRIQNILIKQVFQLSRAKEIERLVQHYQAAMTRFLDRLYEADTGIQIQAPGLRMGYDGFYQSILSLLSFIEERFSKCFDTGEKVPDVYFALASKEMKEQGRTIFNLKSFKERDQIVLDLIATGYWRFLENNSLKLISFADLIYRKMLLKELEDLLAAETEVGATDPGEHFFSSLEQMLIYINYNDKEFIQHMVDRLAAVLSEPPDVRDQIERALQYGKDLNQLPLKPTSSLLSNHPSVIDQLGRWLCEEIYFLERRMNMFAISGSRTTLSEKKALVECRVPVDQLGIFFRAASDTKLLSTPSQKKLFEQIAPYLSTPRRSTLSADSMRSKSYNPERKDIEGVKNLLMVMYKQLAKY